MTTIFLTEYMRSIARHNSQCEADLNELLVTLLVEDGRYYELHQFLQYHILTDSLSVADHLVNPLNHLIC